MITFLYAYQLDDATG